MKTGPAARLLTQVFSILLQLPLSVFNMICYNCHKSQFFIPYLLTPNQCPLNRHQCLLFGNAFHLLRVNILVIFNILHDICNAKYNSKHFVCKNYTIFVLTILFYLLVYNFISNILHYSQSIQNTFCRFGRIEEIRTCIDLLSTLLCLKLWNEIPQTVLKKLTVKTKQMVNEVIDTSALDVQLAHLCNDSL